MEKDAPADGAPKSKRRKVKVQEYLYEPELEGVHQICTFASCLPSVPSQCILHRFGDVCEVCIPCMLAHLLAESSSSPDLLCLAGLYQRSLLKAYTSTVESARFSVVVVDAPNTTVAEYKEVLGSRAR